LEKNEVNETIEEIREFGVKGLGIAADLSKLNTIDSIPIRFFENFDDCDILVNNAGISHYSTVADLSLEKAIQLFKVNLLSYYVLIKKFIPNMIQRKKGKIIMTSSVQGNMFFNPMKVAYSTSKAGVTVMGKCLAAELKEHNIQVNVVLPGAVDTKMVQINVEKGQINPTPKPPNEVSPIYLFLASSLSDKKYDGEIVNEYFISQILSKIKEGVNYNETSIGSILKVMKDKLTKGLYRELRRNKELIEFLLSYNR
jgi:3-oxoacyl-[acyl-carrier protein] reductase